MSRTLSHLRALEAESIHIMREVAAEFERPVMLYSIGKDSSVMVRLAEKAFYPGKPPFPLMHVDTTWKFREMYELRDNYVAKQLGLKELLNNRDSGLFWYWEALEEQLDILGLDPVPYSVGKNRVPIETLLRYCAEQGITDRQLGVEDVFYAGFDG